MGKREYVLEKIVTEFFLITERCITDLSQNLNKSVRFKITKAYIRFCNYLCCLKIIYTLYKESLMFSFKMNNEIIKGEDFVEKN